MSLKTKNVFLTGGAQGLGKSYTEALLKLGARVVFGDINEELGKKTEAELNAKYGPDKVLFIPFDVTKDSQYKEAFSKAVAHLGFVDLLVNNAGILNEQNYELMIAINFTAMVRGTLLAEDHMRKDRGGKGGRVINACSGAGTWTDFMFAHPIYNGSKHAVRSFTTSLAIAPDIKEQGMEYGLICPGAVDTVFCNDLASKVRFAHLHVPMCERVMSTPDQIAAGLVKLATLDNLNGAILEVAQQKQTFVHVVREVIGETYEPKIATWPPKL